MRRLKPPPEPYVPPQVDRTRHEERLHMPLRLSQVKGIITNPDSSMEKTKIDAIHGLKAEDALEAVERMAQREKEDPSHAPEEIRESNGDDDKSIWL